MKNAIRWLICIIIVSVFALVLMMELENAAACKARGGVYMKTFGSMECLDVKTIK